MKYPGKIVDFFNEDSSEKSEEDLPGKEQQKAGNCDRDSDDDCNQR